MAETMLEKAARAMFDKYLELAEDDHTQAERDEMFAEHREGFHETTRAALQAIREPDLKMRRAATTFTGADIDWPAMIDAILSEGKA